MAINNPVWRGGKLKYYSSSGLTVWSGHDIWNNGKMELTHQYKGLRRLNVIFRNTIVVNLVMIVNILMDKITKNKIATSIAVAADIMMTKIMKNTITSDITFKNKL